MKTTLMNFKEYLANKRILITGHTGFKGSWMTAYLHMIGAKVYGFSLEPEYENNLFNLLDLSSKIEESVFCDIRDKKRFKSFFKHANPDYIFHLAAQPLVLDSYLNPLDTFEINFNGTLNVLEEIRLHQNNCSAVIITTDKVYKNKKSLYAYKENDELGGFDPYSSSKSCCELLVSSYNDSFFSKNAQFKKYISTARGGNIIGGADWSRNRLFPDLVKQIFSNSELIIRHPDSVRPWQHVFELISAYLTLAIHNNNSNETIKKINFGPYNDKYFSVKEIVELSIDFLNRGEYVIHDKKIIADSVETEFLALDSSQANEILEWKTKFSTKKAIEKTLEWYLFFYNSNESIVDFSYNQLREFFNE